jgi:hypothetical protein
MVNLRSSSLFPNRYANSRISFGVVQKKLPPLFITSMRTHIPALELLYFPPWAADAAWALYSCAALDQTLSSAFNPP